MSEPVKPRRRYDSRRRREQAEQTRRDIVMTAGALFRERGYASTTMPLIASESGVVVETIYRAFGSKAALFKAVVEAAVAGGVGRAGRDVERRPAIAAITDERDPRRQIERYAATQPGIHARSGPLLRALRDAMGTDPELAALWQEVEMARLSGQGRFAGMLAERGTLRADVTTEQARDVIWTLCSLAVHDLLVIGRGWPCERYEAWLAQALVRELLPGDSA